RIARRGEAARTLVRARIDGPESARQPTAATEMVVRLSCGCLSGMTRPGRVGTVAPTQTALESLRVDHGADVARQLARAVHGSDTTLATGWDRQLLDAFEAELRGAG